MSSIQLAISIPTIMIVQGNESEDRTTSGDKF